MMRNNQFEIVELRYNAAGDVVTDVKEIVRKADNGNLTVAEDKIYGYPFGEILTSGHKVDDEESIYDVVLTGRDAADDESGNPITSTFKFVTRPRTNLVEHTSSGKTFVDTAMGTLRLQGRTLYVLDGQHDYGIDFIRDAKAVVRQHEGYIDNAGEAVSDWKTRAYGSVQEAIDSLGDADKTTGEKEFKGIITAVLNSNGVAEWVVFYSDTVAETKSDTGIGQATIDVEIRTQLPGGKAEFYEIRKVARPTDGTDVAEIEAPDLSAKGFKAVQDPMYLLWKKYDERPVITFEYTKGGVTPPTGNTKTVRVAYVDDATTTTKTYGVENITLNLDAAGFAELNASKFNIDKVAPGFKLKTGATGADFYLLVTSAHNTEIKVEAEARSNTEVTAIAVSGTTVTPAWVKYGDTTNGLTAADVTAAGITFDITYGEHGTRKGVAANFSGITYETGTSAGTTNWTKDGNSVVTLNGKTCTVPVKLYADIATAVAAKSPDLDAWTVAADASQTTKTSKVLLSFTQKTAADFSADDAATLIAKLTDDATNAGVKLTGFALEGSVTPGANGGTTATFKVAVTIVREGDLTGDSVTLKIAAPTT